MKVELLERFDQQRNFFRHQRKNNFHSYSTSENIHEGVDLLEKHLSRHLARDWCLTSSQPRLIKYLSFFVIFPCFNFPFLLVYFFSVVSRSFPSFFLCFLHSPIIIQTKEYLINTYLLHHNCQQISKLD